MCGLCAFHTKCFSRSIMRRLAASVRRLPYSLVSNTLPSTSSQQQYDLVRPSLTAAQLNQAKDVLTQVNEHIVSQSHGRLFAIVYLCGVQHKVTNGDIVVIPHTRAVDVGDQLRIEKVLSVGSSNFTLFGRPLLPSDSVEVTGTVIEKTLSFTEPDFKFVPKKSIRILRLLRHELNFVRINDIQLLKPVSNPES